MANPKNPNRIAVIVLRGFGFLFLAVGGFLTYLTYDFMDWALPETGSVVSIETNYDDDGGVSYKPTIRFVDYTGNKQRGETFMSSSGYNYDIGQKVDIYYDTRDPSSIRIDSWFSLWGFGFVFMGISVVPLLIAMIVSRAGRKKMESSTAERQRETPVKVRRRAHTPSRDDDDGYVNMPSEETAEEHDREMNYRPTVRRGRNTPTIRR